MLLASLPLRYRLYAAYWRIAARDDSRHLRGGSFLLRLLRAASGAAHLSTVVPARVDPHTVLVIDFADARVLDLLHEIRGEKVECAMIGSVLSPGDTFIDVGANFGTLSLFASRIVGSRGKVLVVEPQPRLAQFIRESLRASNAENCEVLEIACGARDGETELLVPENDSGRAGFFPGFSGKWKHERVRVRVSPLDTVAASMPRTGNLTLKIDVEGSEFSVLEGARQTIADRKPSLLIELNPWSARAAGRSVSELLETLSNLGYRRFTTDTSFPQSLPLNEIALDRQINLLAVQ